MKKKLLVLLLISISITSAATYAKGNKKAECQKLKKDIKKGKKECEYYFDMGDIQHGAECLTVLDLLINTYDRDCK